jgi:hypothetical protein
VRTLRLWENRLDGYAPRGGGARHPRGGAPSLLPPPGPHTRLRRTPVRGLAGSALNQVNLLRARSASTVSSSRSAAPSTSASRKRWPRSESVTMPARLGEV